MQSFARYHLLPVLLGVLALALSASADTLDMKDGRVINGKFMSGTQSHVRFLVNDKIELYAVEEVAALTFSQDAKPSPGGSSGTEATQASRKSSSAERSGTPQRVTVPAGTRVLVRMIDSVDSEKNKVGDRFRASLEQDLIVDGTVVARKARASTVTWPRPKRLDTSPGSRS